MSSKIQPPLRPNSDSPIPNKLLTALRVIVFLQCIGVAGRYWFAEFEIESDIYGLLFFEWSWPETLAQRIDDIGALGCLFAGVIALVPTLRLGWDRIRQLQRLAAGFVTAWMFSIAIAHMYRGGVFAELSLGEHAVRYAAPMALVILLSVKESTETVRLWTTLLILKIATAATFAVHGYKALKIHGPFADLVLLTDLNGANFGIGQATVEQILWTIGIVDLVVAVLILFPRMRTVAIYMVFWGILTAASRMTAWGGSAYPETLIRSANWGCPLILAIAYQFSYRTPSDTPQK